MNLLYLFILFLSNLFSQQDDLFPDDDPTLFQHVHVITGHLHLNFEDGVVESAVPLPLTRSYSSAGALERNPDDSDLQLKKIYNNWCIQGGWDLFPHTQLLIQYDLKKQEYTAYVTDKAGNVIKFIPSYKEGKHLHYLKPKDPQVRYHNLSAREDPAKQLLCINTEHHEATLTLPDKTSHYYKGHKHDPSFPSFYYRLIHENLPSGYLIRYAYDKKDHLVRISSHGKVDTKELSWIKIDLHYTHTPYNFSVSTSDGKSFHYQATSYKGRDYLERVRCSFKPTQVFEYTPARKKCGARLTSFRNKDELEVEVEYYEPEDRKKEKTLAKHPEKRKMPLDAVKVLRAPVNGKIQPIAKFTYHDNWTDVTDIKGCLTRYHHDSDKLHKIEYFDPHGNLFSATKFIWQGRHLAAKVLLNSSNIPEFSKVFHYNDENNVTQEILYGNLTGEATAPFSLNKDGSLNHAETFTKTYTYNDSHLLIAETEQEGPTLCYEYLGRTDLLLSKSTYDNSQLLIKETFLYDQNHFLISHTIDDGSHKSIQEYELNPLHHKPKTLIEKSGDGLLYKKTEYKYSLERLPTLQIIYDSTGLQRYTLETTYDAAGRILSQTSPLKLPSLCTYNAAGDLITLQENGGLLYTYTYDSNHRPISCTHSDSEGIIRTLLTSYDEKGRVIVYTDLQGNWINQTFDHFGRCLSTQYPNDRKDTFTYDIAGNPITSSIQGKTTHTAYTTYKKPHTTHNPDGTTTSYRYYLNGLLKQITHPDGSTVHHRYDLLGHLIAKEWRDPQGHLLEQLAWSYTPLRLISHTNAQGLITTYTYNSFGQKISEQAADRTICYTYDELGHLQSTSHGDITLFQENDIAGKPIKTWKEDTFGNKINETHYTYNERGQKIAATRTTSLDQFKYDREGRLAEWIDPLGNTTTYLYTPTSKTIIDAEGNRTIDTFNALNQLIKIEKTNPDHQPISEENFHYNKQGDLIHRISTRFQGTTPIDTTTLTQHYDMNGKVIQEIRPDGSIIRYTYDLMGFPATKELPSGKTLYYTHDSLGRLLSLSTSDNTLHYRYHYDHSLHPTEVEDFVSHTKISRAYNAFDELTQETDSNGNTCYYQYDSLGRTITITLPDRSHIHYLYEGLHLRSIQRRTPQGLLLYDHAYLSYTPQGAFDQERLIGHLGNTSTTYDPLDRPIQYTTPWTSEQQSFNTINLPITHDHTLFGHRLYSYDHLHQLTQENDTSYTFDSLGNPPGTDNAHKLTHLEYDPEGNLTDTRYAYDLLGRLISIEQDGQITHLTYDGLSRLSSYQNKQLFYHDQIELGSTDDQHEILELKVLSPIGNAVAIELNHAIYAPLYDLKSNLIALIDQNGTLIPTEASNPFGAPLSPHITPWQYQDKRTICGLVFFGKRFYDPQLKRWLTPDPAGYVDSVNPYLFLLNSPTSRLDQFGLLSKDRFEIASIEVPISQIPTEIGMPSVIIGKCYSGALSADVVITYSGQTILNFSPEELAAGKINLVNHVAEMSPPNSKAIVLITLINGIRTDRNECQEMHESIKNQVPEGPLMISLHNAQKNWFRTLWDLIRGVYSKKTMMIELTRNFMETLCQTVDQHGKETLWLHIMHSEGGLISERATRWFTSDTQKNIPNHLIAVALGPAHPFPKAFTVHSINYYTTRDLVTGVAGWWHRNDDRYEIQFISSLATWKDPMLFGLVDHAFMGPTYQGALKAKLQQINKDFHFYATPKN